MKKYKDLRLRHGKSYEQVAEGTGIRCSRIIEAEVYNIKLEDHEYSLLDKYYESLTDGYKIPYVKTRNKST